jgi:hypothetical protein
MYTAWHVDKYKITFKLVIDHWPRARYRAAARRLRNIVLGGSTKTLSRPDYVISSYCQMFIFSIMTFKL